MKLTPQVPIARQVIEAYGEGRFRIAGQVFSGSVIVLPSRTVPWALASVALSSAAELLASLAPILSPEGTPAMKTELLLVGCGLRMEPIAAEARAALRAAGIVTETMDTGAACRTYNVLVAEDRLVAAALIAV